MFLVVARILGVDQSELGYTVESVRLWVRQADVDDLHAPGVSTAEAARERIVHTDSVSAWPAARSSTNRLVRKLAAAIEAGRPDDHRP